MKVQAMKFDVNKFCFLGSIQMQSQTMNSGIFKQFLVPYGLKLFAARALFSQT